MDGDGIPGEGHGGGKAQGRGSSVDLTLGGWYNGLMARASRTIEFAQVDVFTDTVFGGNPVAVVHNAHGLTPRQMQQIAREMNLSETAFVLPPTQPEKARFRVRFFTPKCEIPFAGHPTLGTFYVLAKKGLIPLTEPVTRVHQETGLGILPVDLVVQKGAVEKVFMTQPQPTFGRKLDHQDDLMRLASGLGIPHHQLEDQRSPIQVASTGLPVLIVPVKSLNAIAEIRLWVPVIEALCEKYKVQGVMPFSTLTVEEASTVHARMFAPSIGILEDPATGSASGALGAYLVKHHLIPVEAVTRIIAEQGYEMNRPSTIHIEIESEKDAITRVRVGGEVVVALEGTLTF
jgi:trans-2,3-dihydro-3-hydroxyanthranilate isomerase